MTFGTDGFVWGCEDYGPSGLVEILATTLFGFRDGLASQHRHPILQFLTNTKLDTDWTITADELRALRA